MMESYKALTIVREMFRAAQSAGCELEVWKLVTALRGPDDQNEALKANLTTPIRECLIDRTFAQQVGVSDSDGYPMECENRPPPMGRDTGSHFVAHANVAIMVIGRAFHERSDFWEDFVKFGKPGKPPWMGELEWSQAQHITVSPNWKRFKKS